MRSVSLVQLGRLSHRSVVRAFRMPATWIFPTIFPVVLVIVNSAGLADAVKIPGFPTDSYFDFALVVTFMQASMFAMSSAGLGIAMDIETGFMDRLALTPVPAGILVLAQIVGTVVLAFLTSVFYILVGLLGGVDFQSGPLGVVALLGLATATSFAVASLGAWLALRSGSSEALQGIFPLVFAALFMSTTNMPRELIDAGWFHTVVVVNPVSYLVDGMRSLIISSWDWPVLAADVGVVAGIAVVGTAGCARALRARAARA